MGLSKYLVISVAIHGALGGSWPLSETPWAGLAQTVRLQNPIQIATLDIRPSEGSASTSRAVIPDVLGQTFLEKSRRNDPVSREQAPTDEPLSQPTGGRHGIHVANKGVKESYSTQLNAALQRHYQHLFADMPVSNPIEFPLHLEIALDGTVVVAEVQRGEYIRADYLQRMIMATRELKTLPPPPELRSITIPVSFIP